MLVYPVESPVEGSNYVEILVKVWSYHTFSYHTLTIIEYDWIQKTPQSLKGFPVPRPGLEPGWTYMSEGF